MTKHDDYPAPTTGDETRRDVIARIAGDMLSGDLYADDPNDD